MTDADVARCAAEAAEVAFDRVADKEATSRDASVQAFPPRGGGSGEKSAASSANAPDSFSPSEAVLEQRTYFLPVMVRAPSPRPCYV